MIGSVLGSRYEIIEKIGVGGMAEVYKAMDKLLNRNVAVKVLRSEFEGNEEFIRRFNIESQAAASLSHGNVVPIYDVGHSEGRQYIIMEFIEGKTLKEYIAEKKGNISWKEATDISMQICSALEHAHSKHIIHRDIKPQNIMINEDGTVKVTDFGIARAANNGTMTMEAIGSAHYLSPEQARGGYTDQRSDIYSLGVVMYELFTGNLPFDGENPVAVAMHHVQTEPKKPRTINPDIPRSVENIILKAMSKEQRLRYDSATQMLGDIKKVYLDPETPIKAAESEEDQFGTRKMDPIVTINIPSDEKNVVRRSGEADEPVRKTKKKSNRKDVIAVVAAIITCFVIASIMGVVVARIVAGNNEEVVTTYKVKELRQLTYEQAQAAISGTEFEIVVADRIYDSDFPEGTIISQSPLPGEVDAPCEIHVVISRGEKSFKLRDYTGEKPETAVKELEDLGIKVRISEDISDTVEKGLIIRQFPSAENTFKEGDPLTLFVSSGPDTFKLDSYVGRESSEAKSELSEKGVKVVISEEYSDSVPVGIVIKQSPQADTDTKKDDTVTLYVSKGIEQIKVPNLVGLDEAKARDAIKNNKLTVGEVKIVASGNKGLVVKQSVDADTVVPKGTVIDISVGAGEAAVQTSQDGL